MGKCLKFGYEAGTESLLHSVVNTLIFGKTCPKMFFKTKAILISPDYGTKYNFLEMAQSDSKMIQKLPNWAKNDWNWPQNDLNTT